MVSFVKDDVNIIIDENCIPNIFPRFVMLCLYFFDRKILLTFIHNFAALGQHFYTCSLLPFFPISSDIVYYAITEERWTCYLQ